MKLRALAFFFWFTTVAQSEPPTYWLCVDPAGYRVEQDEPCAAPLVPLTENASSEPAIRLTSETQPKRRPIRPATTPAGKPEPAYALQPLKPQALVFWALAFLGLGFVVLQTALATISRRRAAVTGKSRLAPSRRREPQLQRPALPTAKPVEWTLELVRQLPTPRLAELCEAVWRLRSYRALPITQGNAAWTDVHLYSPAHTLQLLAVIRCKAGTEPAGPDSLREFADAARALRVKLAMFCAPAGFTSESLEFAAGKSLRLFAAQDLLEQVSALPDGLQKSLLIHVTRR